MKTGFIYLFKGNTQEMEYPPKENEVFFLFPAINLPGKG